MKRLLFIVLTLLFCITSFAEEKKIKLEKDGTRPHHVHYPPYSVIVNYNQPYLD